MTPGIVLVDEHYRALGVEKGWNNEQLNRLCAMYRSTPHELGRLCCVYGTVRNGERPQFYFMEEMIRKDHFPPVVALHFSILERCFLENVHGVMGEPVMPVDLVTGRGQEAEGRGQRAEARGQRPEDRGQSGEGNV